MSVCATWWEEARNVKGNNVGRQGSALSDRYTIEAELGAGGMATVYLANGLWHDRKVAPIDTTPVGVYLSPVR